MNTITSIDQTSMNIGVTDGLCGVVPHISGSASSVETCDTAVVFGRWREYEGRVRYTTLKPLLLVPSCRMTAHGDV